MVQMAQVKKIEWSKNSWPEEGHLQFLAPPFQRQGNVYPSWADGEPPGSGCRQWEFGQSEGLNGEATGK